MTPKAQVTKVKIDKLNYIKIKDFCISKGTINSKKATYGMRNANQNHNEILFHTH